MRHSWTAGTILLCAQGSLSAFTCGNEDVVPVQVPALSSIVGRQAGNATAVDVYFHIGSTQANKDRITDRIVADQFQVLRGVYQRYGFAFNHVNTSRVVDDVIGKGFYGEDTTIGDYDAYVDFLNTTRRGGYDALNLFFFTDLKPSLGGQCNLPRSVTGRGDYNVAIDGCIINGDTMPGLEGREGSPQPGPRTGVIAVHEIGHWFGLLHTFNGRPCDAINDGIADTPAQAGGTTGCPASRDSCPDIEGLDPIHNFMDYSDDEW